MASGYLRGISAPLLPNTKEKKHRSGRRKGEKFDKHGNSREAQIQNVKAARVYVFGDSNLVEDDENVEFEMPEMTASRHRGTSTFAQRLSDEEEQPAYFEKEIDEGETLQAIALKYACPVAELKRLNNLIQDQEFFGLRVLKVPMKKYGILSEEVMKNSSHNKNIHAHPKGATALPADSDGDPYASFMEEDNDSHTDMSDPETQMRVLRTLSIRDNMSSQGREAEKFLRKMDTDLAKIKQDSRKERESLSEVISVLTNKSFHPLASTRPTNGKHNGADCGMSWWSVLLYSLVVGIVVPIVFLIYFFFFKS